MLRTALRPKWLGLLAFVCLVVVSFGWLGAWQLDVAQKKGQAEALADVENAPEEPLVQVVQPQTSLTGAQVGRKVVVSGEYDHAHQIIVVDRRLGDRVGAWVVTPLIDRASGARIAVVRGFVDDPAAAPPAPTGQVEVHGVLQPQEGPPDTPRALPPGQMPSINVSALVNEWRGPAYNAFVFAQSEEPPAQGAAAQLTVVPPPVTDVGGMDWRNFFYAIQWWVFAAFAVYLWWRSVRDDHLLERATSEADTAGGDGAHTSDPARTAPAAPTEGTHA